MELQPVIKFPTALQCTVQDLPAFASVWTALSSPQDAQFYFVSPSLIQSFHCCGKESLWESKKECRLVPTFGFTQGNSLKYFFVGLTINFKAIFPHRSPLVPQIYVVVDVSVIHKCIVTTLCAQFSPFLPAGYGWKLHSDKSTKSSTSWRIEKPLQFCSCFMESPLAIISMFHVILVFSIN